jgi:hypothetical protein
VVAARRRIQQDSFGLAPIRATAGQRKMVQDALAALRLVADDRQRLQNALSGIAGAVPPPVHLDSIRLARSGLQWKTTMVGALLAIGTFISTLTKNQIIAGAVTFGVCLLLWVLEWVSGYETATWARVLAYMSVIKHFESFAKGVLDSKDAIFYITVIFLGLFFTARSMESLRWRS